MVGHFVRLKLRLLANRLRTESVLGTIGFILIWVAAVIGGVLGGLAFFGLGRLTDEPGLILILAYTAAFIGWLVIPPLVSALDETLDPRRFELLPLNLRRLTTGLLVAGAVGPGGAATLIGLVIVTFGLFPDWPLTPVLLVVVAVELMMCLLVARLVTTFFSILLASRRTRELATLIFAVVIATVAILPSLLGDLNGNGEPQIEITLTSLPGLQTSAWLPPGALARSVSLFTDGDILGGTGLTVYGMVATLGIGWAWARSIRKMLVTAPTTGRRGRKRAEDDRTLALVPTWLRLPHGPLSAVVAKELRYIARDNRVRAQLIGGLIPAVIILILARDVIATSPYAPFLIAAITYLVVFAILANQFGYDGGSFWGYVVSPAPLSDVAMGKNLAWGMIAFGPGVVVAVGLAIWGGDLSFLAAAILVSMPALLVASAIGNVASIYGAFRIPETNPFSNTGFSGNAFVAVILSMMASGALLLPLMALVGLPAVFLGPIAATAGSLLGIGYGVVMYRLGMRLTSRLLIERQQNLLDIIDGESR